jgi:hypothetical protein
VFVTRTTPSRRSAGDDERQPLSAPQKTKLLSGMA